MKTSIDQWTNAKSLRKFFSSVFGKGARSKHIPESTAQTSPVTNTVSVPVPTDTATGTTSACQTSMRDEFSSISAPGSKILKRVRASRTKSNSPLHRQPLSPSSAVLTDATSLSPPQINLRRCHTCSYESPAPIIDSKETSGRAPLTAKYPEIFIYMGRNGVPNSALALTKDIVRNMNEIFRLEGQVNDHRKDIDRVGEEYERVISTLKEPNRLLPSSSTTRGSDREAKLEELIFLSDISSRIQNQKRVLQEVLEREDGELSEQRKVLFSRLRDVLEDRNLLDTTGKDARSNQFYRMPAAQLIPRHEEPRAGSEQARERAGKKPREAVDHMKEMGYQLQEAHQKLNNWKHYYEYEYADYARAVKNGTMGPARSFFDLTLLQEHQVATEEVIEAENNHEKARGQVKELKVVLSNIYQSSGFANFSDDGYRASMEDAMANEVDREWILSWMEKNDDGIDFGDDGDEWEAMSIGLDDSVSVVAEGRERKRIDGWEKRCLAIDNDCTELPAALEYNPDPKPRKMVA
ncbi:fbcc060d-04c1-4045-b9b0-c69ee3030fcc-CDS [Sclerotinia trifoliorum]|uniref:Fbcc060d-04c1-4045-b9b0-c69ee3030fcc-CDS n=1 Tax=Sclerotinia trifoliorum TaxID=28548 RepID=A0A8H2VWH5_9HELO|nr:fbcc060d-04c1-4045-b9b0-c69ee3030fcc-CDS [Sclerotinia trifoliorum]